MRPVIVCGGREGTGQAIVSKALDAALVHPYIPTFDFVVVGSFRGTDREAWEWALVREMPAVVWPAKWKTGTRKGRAEGPLRNRAMLRGTRPRVVLGFPGGSGTSDMMTIACQASCSVWWYSPADGLWVFDDRCDLPEGDAAWQQSRYTSKAEAIAVTRRDAVNRFGPEALLDLCAMKKA